MMIIALVLSINLVVYAGIVHASPVYTSFETGHSYEAVFISELPSGITWDDARTQAESMTYYGLQGYLATITSTSENSFIGSNFENIHSYWIGGFQPEGSSEPDGNWQWITGETWDFTAWAPDEPNNAYGGEWGPVPGGGTDENHLEIHNSLTEWNDYPGTKNRRGFIVEYNVVPEPISSILFVTGGTLLAGIRLKRKKRT